MTTDSYPIPNFLTVTQAADQLGVARGTIYNRVVRGLLTAREVAGTTLIVDDNLMAAQRATVPEKQKQAAS